MKLNRQKYELARARACKGFKDIVEAGVFRGTLCRVMSGEEVRPETIGKIAKALGCDVLEIIVRAEKSAMLISSSERRKTLLAFVS